MLIFIYYSKKNDKIYVEIIKQLLKKGADKTLKDDNGNTAFDIAKTVTKSSEILNLLQ